jgi:hypothetical protein
MVGSGMVQGMGTPRKQRELNVKADEVVALASLWRGVGRHLFRLEHTNAGLKRIKA